MLAAFTEEKDINFDLFDKDYFSVREVFSLHNQLPFNQEDELVKQTDVRRFQEKPGGASLASKRYGASKAASTFKGGKGGDWSKN